PDTLRAPYVAFVQTNRVRDERGFFVGPPDLAIEVVSPTDRFTEVEEKVRDDLNAGTPLVIVVDPRNETAWVHAKSGGRRLTIDDSLEAPDLLPGWSLPLRELFA